MDRLIFTNQGAADNIGSGTAAPLTWDALQNMGVPISYEAFDKRWKQEEQLPPEQQFLHNKVEKYDGNGIVLKTHDNEEQPGDMSKKSNAVDQMAKRATNKNRKFD